MLDANKLQQAVDQAYTQFHSLNGGQNADYIPFLANVPGQLAAVAIVTCDGNIYRAGDSDYRFALESISKVCTLALALEDVGPQAVQDKVGADPTGLPFNSVIALELHGGKPLSPLVNAGAIATTSLINAENAEQRWQRILHIQQQLAGEQVALSDEVKQSNKQPTSITGPLPGCCTPPDISIVMQWKPVTCTPVSAPRSSILLNWQRLARRWRRVV